MALTYNKLEWSKRKQIMNSHTLFGNFLDIDIINALLQLFDNTYNNAKNTNHTIIKYIEDERKAQGLSRSRVKVISNIYGIEDNSPSLFLGIIKNGKKFIHLSIHLAIQTLNPKLTGIVHIAKNVYRNAKKQYYALISIDQPPNKPHSLRFQIADGATTSNAPNAPIYDEDVKKEMSVIITVLNRLFDENNQDFYIGTRYNYNKSYNTWNNTQNNTQNNTLRNTQNNTWNNTLYNIFPIHPRTYNVIKGINTHTTYAKRYNYTKKVHNIYKNMKNRRTVNNK